METVLQDLRDNRRRLREADRAVVHDVTEAHLQALFDDCYVAERARVAQRWQATAPRGVSGGRSVSDLPPIPSRSTSALTLTSGVAPATSLTSGSAAMAPLPASDKYQTVPCSSEPSSRASSYVPRPGLESVSRDVSAAPRDPNRNAGNDVSGAHHDDGAYSLQDAYAELESRVSSRSASVLGNAAARRESSVVMSLHYPAPFSAASSQERAASRAREASPDPVLAYHRSGSACSIPEVTSAAALEAVVRSATNAAFPPSEFVGLTVPADPQDPALKSASDDSHRPEPVTYSAPSKATVSSSCFRPIPSHHEAVHVSKQEESSQDTELFEEKTLDASSSALLEHLGQCYDNDDLDVTAEGPTDLIPPASYVANDAAAEFASEPESPVPAQLESCDDTLMTVLMSP